jgi:uncharacterized membrane protein YraQ (UPF0718 family)
MGAQSTTSRAMTVQGSLLIVVAVIHLAMTGEIASIVARNTSPKAFAFLWPPYALDHIVVGILLLPIGVTTMLCASGVAQGDVRARRIALANAIAVLSLPIAVGVAVPKARLLTAPAFLVSTAILGVTGLWMLWPVLGRRLRVRVP